MLFLSEFLIIIFLVLNRTVASISYNNNKYQFFDRDKDLSHFNKALLGLSNTAIIHQKARQNFHKPLLSSAYYSNLNYHQYNNNNNNPYKIYSANKFQQSAFIENTQESIMDALFSIAQNDDLQCVPKLLCEITSGGLTGRQIDLPINLNVDSLTTLLSGVNSANMSPIIHFGKAAFLGFASSNNGNSRSCFNAYPKCPSDPNKLLKYLNNHNGGFFRYFQGFSSSPDKYNSIMPENDDDDDIAKTLSTAEKRIQNHPYYYTDDKYNNFHYYKEHRGLNSFFENSNTKVAFPEENNEKNNNNNDVGFYHQSSLKFPTTENKENVRQSKKLIKFFDADDDDNGEYQKPLPNHIPTRNIFPDRTGTGELKLDFNELEHHYQNSLLTTNNNNNNNDEYQQLLYDSFPNMDKIRKPSISIFPK